MPAIQLKTNIVKPLAWIYSFIYLAALCLLVWLISTQSISIIWGLVGFTFLILAYVFTINKWLKLSNIQYAILLNDGQWILNYSDGNQQDVTLCDNSILTNRLALLQFKVGQLKRESVFIWRCHANQQAYHALALWWNSAR